MSIKGTVFRPRVELSSSHNKMWINLIGDVKFSDSDDMSFSANLYDQIAVKRTKNIYDVSVELKHSGTQVMDQQRGFLATPKKLLLQQVLKR